MIKLRQIILSEAVFSWYPAICTLVVILWTFLLTLTLILKTYMIIILSSITWMICGFME